MRLMSGISPYLGTFRHILVPLPCMNTLFRACISIAFLLTALRGSGAQTGTASARLTARVSAAVAVSASEVRTLSGQAQVSVAGVNSSTVAVSISSPGDVTRISIPLQLRSNVGYRLQASLFSADDLAVRLSVADLRATGLFVHANALEGIRVEEAPAAPQRGHVTPVTVRDKPSQITIMSGPPVSRAGTFSSPGNAVEVVLSIEVRPRAGGKPWSTELTISATPGR